MSPHKIPGPPFWLGTKDKEERHRKPDRHKWERDSQRIEKGAWSSTGRGRPETQGETDRTGRRDRDRHKRQRDGRKRQGEAETGKRSRQ